MLTAVISPLGCIRELGGGGTLHFLQTKIKGVKEKGKMDRSYINSWLITL